ncbi:MULTISPECIES: APC family permease [unclassified Shewanella]|uniref:APC family permease n=1 Tax=unclassified Shewanella TaxID=196818 RepID=UPI001BBFE1BA|nr:MULTISPECIES: amino acid permease [unclassified Shewanella]GIU10758.1 amino acid permease [Shewanella sp. MBTL60-112-B1]GIU32884.1 amino acid permease [Shewanella sp. MBTL60-112-B2]
MTQNNTSQPQDYRVMGFWRVWALAVGCAIGSGIFMMPTLLAPYGMLGLSSWLVAGAGTVLIALTFARLATRIPKTGGLYIYADSGLGAMAGFIVGWCYWISCLTAVASVAIAFISYLSAYVPILAEHNQAGLIACLGLIWLIIGLNIRSVKGSSIFQVITTILKIAPLLILAALGLINMQPEMLPEYNPTELSPIAAISAATMLVMWSFLGIESATVPAGNVIQPEKTIPRAIIASVLTILVLYILVSLAVNLTVSTSELKDSTAPFKLAAERLMGPIGAIVVTLGALLSTLGSLNANTLMCGQMPMAIATNGLFPKRFKRLSKNGTPTFGLLVSGAIVSVLLIMNYTKGLIGAFTFLVMMATLATLMAYTLCAIAEFYFLKQDKPSAARNRAIILGIGTFVYSLFCILGAGQEIVFYSFFLILLGLPIYALQRKPKTMSESETSINEELLSD